MRSRAQGQPLGLLDVLGDTVQQGDLPTGLSPYILHPYPEALHSLYVHVLKAATL